MNSYSFVNGVEICNFKAKDSEINAASLCLGNDSKDFFAYNMKKTGLYGYVYDFLLDYDTINAADISDIHNYLIKKRHKKMFGFIKKCSLDY